MKRVFLKKLIFT